MTTPDQQICNAIASGRAVLVTGAGFSAGVVDKSGQSLPLGRKLAEEIWPIGFGNQPFDRASSLGEIFRVCRAQNGTRLREHLELAYTVDPSKVPHRYLDWFQLPWHRIYTLNIDDLDRAVDALTPGGAGLNIVSARRSRPTDVGSADSLTVVHLNGDLRDYPNVTFDPTDFGGRSANPDPWYPTFVADLVSHPVIFVGTVLDEPPLWHYLALRGDRGGGSEARPRSWLVTKDLPIARQSLLKSYNIDIWEGYEDDFYTSIVQPELPRLARPRVGATSKTARRAAYLTDVADELVSDPTGSSDFLLGAEPTWGDIFNGFSVSFKWDAALADTAQNSISKIVIVHGNAGSGKSTSLRRLAVTMAASGRKCYWLSPNGSDSTMSIRQEVRLSPPDAIFIDDADRFSESLIPFVRGLSSDNPNMLIVAASRTSRLTQLQIDTRTEALDSVEQRDLDREDATLLVGALERGHRLGHLLSIARSDRVQRILDRWDGQLLVTLISATSGGRFQDFISGETSDLSGEKQAIYGVIAVAQASGTGVLDRDDALVAGKAASNAGVLAYRQLVHDRLVVEKEGTVGTRHRVIAEGVVQHFRSQDHLKIWVRDLLYLFGMRYEPSNVTRGRYGRLLIRFLNHDFLKRMIIESSSVSWVYEELETLLSPEFHYWLQRGSFETTHGDWTRAETFLAQARAMKPDDIRADTAWFYLGLLRAIESPHQPQSLADANDALDGLYAILKEQPKDSPHTYDIFLNRGLKWFSLATTDRVKRLELRERLLEQANIATYLYPNNTYIRRSAQAVHRTRTIVI